MSAYGTKKEGSDAALQLTYPLNFERAYSFSDSYFPSSSGAPLDIMVGTDEQAQYHEAKRIDANMSVMNGIQANKSAQVKLLTGPHNYHLPKPVLSQRRYANPSLGDVGFQSTRRDNGVEAPFRMIEVGVDSMMGAGLRGGVRTNEGYDYYRGQLQRRIGQLDRVNALAEGYAVPIGQEYETGESKKVGDFDKVSFYTTLEALIDSVGAGDFYSGTFDNDIDKVIQFMVRYIPTLDDTSENQQEIAELIRNIQQDALEPMIYIDANDMRGDDMRRVDLVRAYLTAILSYLKGMMGGLSLQFKDRNTLSKSLVRQHRLDRFKPTVLQAEDDYMDAAITGNYGSTVGSRTTIRGGPSTSGGDDDGDSGGSPGLSSLEFFRNNLEQRARRGVATQSDVAGFGDYYLRRVGRPAFGPRDDMFSRPAATREDEESGFSYRAPFAGRSGDPSRERAALRAKPVRGGPSFFGEDAAAAAGGDGAPYIAYPLDLAGFDPAAQAPPQEGDEDTIVQALESVVDGVLDPLKTDADRDLSTDQLVSKHYPQKQVFVNEVEKAMEERGFNKAQIARAMGSMGDEVYDAYISENSGPTGPERALPATLYRPSTSKFAPLYDPSGGLPPVSEEPAGVLTGIGFPATREELRLQAKSIQDVIGFGRLIPAEYGGPYVPRYETKLSNAITALIAKVRKIDPNY
jgi:hypothetical protein